MLRPFLLAALLALCHASAFAASPLCASPEQAAKVQALYATDPVPPTFMAATKLGMSEGIVASAIPAKQVIGTTGAGFRLSQSVRVESAEDM